jgi:hypothetical protein
MCMCVYDCLIPVLLLVLCAVLCRGVQLNPFQASTDSALFSFKTESTGVLANGPFELRIRQDYHPLIVQIWESNTRNFLKTANHHQTPAPPVPTLTAK